MGNKNKLQKKVTPQIDIFDVRSNLKKLGASLDRNSYMGNGATKDDYLSSGAIQNGAVTSFQDNELKTTFELHALKQDKKLTDELFSLKESVHIKINQDVKDLKTEVDGKINCFEGKLDSKVDNKYFTAAISVLLFISTLIGALSYFPMTEDIKDLNKNNEILKDSIIKINSRIDKIKYSKK